jgi:hypothetical protein
MMRRLSPSPRAAVVVLLALLGAGCTTTPSYGPEPVQAPAAPSDSVAPSPPAAPSATRPEPANEPAAAPRERSRAELELERGTRSYEDGDYRNAGRHFQSALDLGLPTLTDQARAHKYLAFIACASGRQRPCRDEFRKALEADTAFTLTAAEAGHPVWGPVYRSVKVELAKAKPKPKDRPGTPASR